MEKLNMLIITETNIEIIGFEKAKTHLLLRRTGKADFFIIPDGNISYSSDMIIPKQHAVVALKEFQQKYADTFAGFFLYSHQRYIAEEFV